MDDTAKNRFKWKFYGLTIELNIIILLFALSIIVFFIVHSPYTVPLIIGMLILAFIFTLDFLRKYQRTKKWLEDQPDKEEVNPRQNGTIK